MITVHWRFYRIPKSLFYLFKNGFAKCRLTLRSLTYNHFTDESYAADVCMEPLFWFVDNFTNALGPLFVVAVIGLTASVVAIAYWIGLPYWWERNHYICVVLIVMGNWLLVNIAFHYYMAVVTPPGYPPENELITEAVSICKKCISPKPPRTHHCSVCKRCILKMDHHCPWLNNCVGYRNHRYFFLYIVYMMIGMMFVMIFGFDVFYTAVYLTAEDLEDPELEGLPVKLSHSGGIIPVADLMYLNSSTASVDLSANHEGQLINPWRRRAIIYMALINVGAFVALGFLLLMHSQLISKGETCIESNINKAELLRFKNYKNPYNFGKLKNWNIFLGLVRERTFLKHVLLPSNHEPVGDGLTWYTIHDQDVEEWP